MTNETKLFDSKSCYWHDQLFEKPKEMVDFFLWDTWFQFDLFSSNQVGKGGMIFRGHSDSSWELVPSAFREGALNEYSPQPPHPTTRTAVKRYLGWQLHAEARAIYIFLESADALGIPTPIDYSMTKESLDLILSALNEKEYDYDEPFPSQRFQRATALAQHHGVPTRFLDWTESPLTAMYFAAYGASSFSPRPSSGEFMSVIFMTTRGLSNKDSPFELIRAPRFENSNLRQQRGVFTNIRSANSFWLENGRWPCMDDLSSGEYQLQRVRLPSVMADELLRLLFSLGISRHSLMPSLDNAARAYAYSKVLFPS